MQLVQTHLVEPSKPKVRVDTGRLMQSVAIDSDGIMQDRDDLVTNVVFGSQDGKTYRPSVRNDFRGRIVVDYAIFMHNLNTITAIMNSFSNSI